ncbi:ribosomal protein S18 acetylase RimI-like enzyme [Nocardioides albertanoniae]|uniref:Ribosomal protein S18 acetylase RimI-like enzyme n=1 Tax=Nocardioides albertanoniae TaxID=1175486 RepID=A0A543ABH1_9ACTN|nr:GNAT family N-acetyltransferase [Nocardioides albertanoniae]TQL69909.1 ribosomal protein S18 acetylase RimI-like enzyme [Nocardioides albertanoniae]
MSDQSETPVALPDDWTTKVPDLDDLPALLRLRAADKTPFEGSDNVDSDVIAGEVAGAASWTRQQLLAVDPAGDVRAWAIAHDRAAGRTLVYLYVDRTIDQAAEVAAGLYAWLEEQGRAMAEFRGITESHLDASPFADDTVQREWLADAQFTNKRTWLHMSRPVVPGEDVPALRDGVTIHPVETHENGLPVAVDLQTVHHTLEESFQDHFNSYRESFPEFVQRLREEPGHRWDHWWLAYVDNTDGEVDPDGEAQVPAGSLVASVLPANAAGVEGTYVEYIGVNRHARGRGVAKGLLHAVIGDALERGRDRVCLEVDADSPTGADGLYKSMGWVTDYITESWHKDVTV